MDKFITSLPRGVKRKKAHNTGSYVKENKKNNFVKNEKCQMFLDLGQKTFGINIQCKKCNFFYVLGDVEDEKEHNKFCASAHKAVSFTTLKSFPSTVIKEINESKILSIPPSSLKTDKCMKNISIQMYDDFGFDIESVTATKDDVKLYIFVQNGYILGCLFFEHVLHSDVVLLAKQVQPSDVHAKFSYFSSAATSLPPPPSSSSSSSFSCHLHPCPLPCAAATSEYAIDKMPNTNVATPTLFVLGVRYIWVHKSSRRKGIAGQLCDAARKHALFGTLFDKGDISFSQPTSVGMDFAKAYTNADSIWAYS